VGLLNTDTLNNIEEEDYSGEERADIKEYTTNI